MQRIVVIEDSATQAAAVRIALRKAGFEVDVAREGAAGVELCRKRAPDLVLTDIIMPKMDGYAVTRALKADSSTAHVPVIVMTTLDDPKHVLEAARAGADNYITKPLVMSSVLPRIQRALTGTTTDDALMKPALAEMLVSCLEDAAARHRALEAKQRELEQANAQREQAMRVVAHELRGPLQALSMRAAAARAAQGALLSSLPESIDGQVVSMVRIIDDLTDLTDLDLGRMALERAALELPALVERIVDDVRGLHPTRAIMVEDRGCPSALADDTRIGQVTRNLLTNAIKYTKGTIHVEVGRHGAEQVEVRVQDEGPGLSEEDARKVFERYARVDDRSSKPRGAGLGLYICKRIIELHGGAMGVDSDPKRGSTFWFRLQLAPPQ